MFKELKVEDQKCPSIEKFLSKEVIDSILKRIGVCNMSCVDKTSNSMGNYILRRRTI